MAYKCKSCGAKLKVKKNQTEVRCEYCGTTNKIEYSQSDFYRDTSKRSKKIIMWSFIVFGVIMLFSFIPMLLNTSNFVCKKNGGSDNNWDFKFNAKEIYFNESGCFLTDFNNDDVLDIVGIASKYGDNENYFLHSIDGENGKILKTTELKRNKNPELFPVKKYFFISKDDFTLTVYNQKIEKEKTFSLTDKVEYYDINQDTLYIETYDEKKWKLNLNSLSIKKENFEFENSTYLSSNYNFNTWDTDGEHTYVALPKEKSSKNLYTVVALNTKTLPKEDETAKIDTLWQLPMSFESVGGEYQIIVAEQNIITPGNKFTAENKPYLVAIDKTEGIVKYEIKICDTEGIYIKDFFYNEKYLIVNIYGSMIAYEPSTGKIVWKSGGYNRKICN